MDGRRGEGRVRMGKCNLDVEESETLFYMLLCDILYSIQRFKTSEEPGGQNTHSLNFEIIF